jgi:hypothetical protein
MRFLKRTSLGILGLVLFFGVFAGPIGVAALCGASDPSMFIFTPIVLIFGSAAIWFSGDVVSDILKELKKKHKCSRWAKGNYDSR